MPRSKAFNKDEILFKALRLFWERGFHATSVDDLVDTLGISRSSLYATFGDKNKLFTLCLDTYRQESDRVLRELASQAPTAKDAIAAMFFPPEEGYRMGCFVCNSATELAQTNPEVASVVTGNREDMALLFTEIIERGKASNEFSNDLDAQALGLFFLNVSTGIQVGKKAGMSVEAFHSIVETSLLLLQHS
jgi:TetR/AcrR family transcriptional repressor of nem operon